MERSSVVNPDAVSTRGHSRDFVYTHCCAGRIRNTGVDDEPIPFPNIRSTGIPIRGTSSSPEKRQRSESSGALTIAPKRSKTRLTQLAAEGEAQERINQALEQRLLLFERMREAGMEIPAGIERP